MTDELARQEIRYASESQTVPEKFVCYDVFDSPKNYSVSADCSPIHVRALMNGFFVIEVNRLYTHELPIRAP